MSGTISCPACCSHDVSAVFSVDSYEAAQHFALQSEDGNRHALLRKAIETLWNSSSCAILRCGSCDFTFASPFVAGDASFYNAANATHNYPRARWEFSRTRRQLKNRKTPKPKALEIGAGFGYFLDSIRNVCIDQDDIYATEYSSAAIDVLRAKGYSTIECDIREGRFDDFENRFDYVFMFHVLEHMDDPKAALGRVAQLLRRGGSIFIAVPNHHRIEMQESINSLIDMPPNHIGRWTPAALGAASKRAGLSLAHYEYEPFKLIDFIKQDLAYSHIRRAQTHDSLSRKVRSLKRSKLRTAAEALTAIAYAPTRVGSWVKVYEQRERMGGSLWAQLDRTS